MEERVARADPVMVGLRDVTPADLPVLFEQQIDPVASEMAAFPPREHDAFMAHWARIMADDTVVTKAVVVTGEVAGQILSWLQSGVREIGFWLGRDYWGRGIATAALRAFLPELTDRPLRAHVAKHNVGSLRVLEKCGFVVTGEARVPLGDGRHVDEVVLELRR
jgi:RimJ/RimL family protein N-acetyltransferase